MKYLLDTSAWLAHYRQEAGAEHVTDVLAEPDNDVTISALSLVEFHARLKAEGLETYFEAAREAYSPLFTVLAVTSEIAARAIELRNAATARLPVMDALIAATAAVNHATLVHRDPHFRSLPGAFLQQDWLIAGLTADDKPGT